MAGIKRATVINNNASLFLEMRREINPRHHHYVSKSDIIIAHDKAVEAVETCLFCVVHPRLAMPRPLPSQTLQRPRTNNYGKMCNKVKLKKKTISNTTNYFIKAYNLTPFWWTFLSAFSTPYESYHVF